MCEFYYYWIKEKYDYKPKLHYTDTDSFILHIKTEDYFEDIQMMKKKGLILLITNLEDFLHKMKTKSFGNDKN